MQKRCELFALIQNIWGGAEHQHEAELHEPALCCICRSYGLVKTKCFRDGLKLQESVAKCNWGMRISMDRGFYTKDIKLHSYPGTKKSKQVLLSSLLSSHDFSQVTKDRAWEGLEMCQGGIKLFIKTCFFIERVVKHWNGLPREMVTSSSLGILRGCMMCGIKGHACWWDLVGQAGGWKGWSWSSFPNKLENF